MEAGDVVSVYKYQNKIDGVLIPTPSLLLYLQPLQVVHFAR